jgi:hypothetical protein
MERQVLHDISHMCNLKHFDLEFESRMINRGQKEHVEVGEGWRRLVNGY